MMALALALTPAAPCWLSSEERVYLRAPADKSGHVSAPDGSWYRSTNCTDGERRYQPGDTNGWNNTASP
jgi:hypothetical protein